MITAQSTAKKEWSKASLEDVCLFLDNKRVPVNEIERHRRTAGKPQSELYPYYGANGQVGWIDDFIFSGRFILLAEDGGFFGSSDRPVAYEAQGNFWVNNHAHVLKPKAEIIDFDYCLQSIRIRPDIGGIVAGSTRKKLTREAAGKITLLLPPLDEQRKIASRLSSQLEAVKNASNAVSDQITAAESFIDCLLRESLEKGIQMPIRECLREVTAGIGSDWAKYPVLGATRAGLAPAKEGVGKYPERYKPVRHGTIFYNPMRILLGSIAMIDDGDPVGITSPDYVAMTAIEGKLHPRWFYYWFRSKYGAEFIKSMSRGAVRERLLFKRLAPAKIKVPDWNTQLKFAAQVAEIRALRKSLQDRLDALEKLPAALLRKVFNGNS